MTDDWFRSPHWSAEARDDFEARLARARPYNRAQYMRIKGLALSEAGERRGARELWERVLQSTEELATTQQASALEHLGDSYVRENVATAENYYRTLLAQHPTLNGTSHTVEISHQHRSGDGRKGNRAARGENGAGLGVPWSGPPTTQGRRCGRRRRQDPASPAQAREVALHVRTIQIRDADCRTRIKRLAAFFTLSAPESPHRVGDK